MLFRHFLYNGQSQTGSGYPSGTAVPLKTLENFLSVFFLDTLRKKAMGNRPWEKTYRPSPLAYHPGILAGLRVLPALGYMSRRFRQVLDFTNKRNYLYNLFRIEMHNSRDFSANECIISVHLYGGLEYAASAGTEYCQRSQKKDGFSYRAPSGGKNLSFLFWVKGCSRTFRF